VISPADDAAEGSGCGAARARLRLAVVEKGVADPAAAIAFEQHRFAEIEGPTNVKASRGERLSPGRILRRERCRGRGADDVSAVAGNNDECAFGSRKGREIIGLIFRIAIVEIGKGAEYRDAQPRELRDDFG